MTKNKIWFIIVAYYPKPKQIKRLVAAVAPWPVVVVDNRNIKYQILNIKYTSQKSNQKSKIKILKSKTNLGYAGGSNVGVGYALAHGAEWVVVLNDDLDLTKKAVSSLCETLGKTSPAIVGPFAGELDRRRWTTIYPSLRTGPSDRVNYISGSCFAIHRDVIDKIGYFYDPYFMYYEEVDYCLRAGQAGFPIIHLSLAGIGHKDSATMNRGSFLHQYYHARNHLLFIERQALWQVKAYELIRLPKTIWEHYQRGESGALLGIKDYLLRRFGRLKSRF